MASKAAVAAGGLGASVLFVPTAEAATFTVSNLDDSGAGSLRQAVLDAEAAAGADTIVFASGLSGTITLTTGEIVITEDLEIQGPGPDVITVSGNDASQIFYANGTDGSEIAFSFSGLTLRDGYDASGGGALYTGDTRLTISNSVLTGNETGDDGGAIYNSDGSLTIESSVVSNNDAADYGGGFHAENNDAGDIVVRDSTLTGNDAEEGGAMMIYDINNGHEPGTANGILIERTTVSGNSASEEGGGIYFEDTSSDGATAPIVIDASTISGNEVTGGVGDGGGISFSEDLGFPITVQNSTVSGNSATNHGGGIFLNDLNDADGGSLTVLNSTVAENSADVAGGGIFRDSDPMTIRGSIVANNTSPTGDVSQDAGASGSFTVGFSLIENIGAGTAIADDPAGSNITGTDPALGPLADNGGPTQTHEPLFTSQVLDAAIANGLTTDQRGFARTVELPITNRIGSDGTDIGAVEVQACQGEPAHAHSSSDADDTITGTPEADLISAQGGNDTANALAGNDCVAGDAGDDTLGGDEGKDLVSGGEGNDTARGGAGKDEVSGEAGKDRLKGNGGKDKLTGSGGKDKLNGDAGKDKVSGGAGKDRIKGGNAKDKIKGNGGKDAIDAIDGKVDKVNCGGGKDTAKVDAVDKVSANCDVVKVKGG